jgi:hypothetical protein
MMGNPREGNRKNISFRAFLFSNLIERNHPISFHFWRTRFAIGVAQLNDL